MAKRHHWLAEIARDNDLPNAGEVDLAPGMQITEAWAAVCKQCGVDEATLATVVARHFGLEPVDQPRPQTSALKLLPGDWARRHGVLPLWQDDNRIGVATADPANLMLEEEIRFTTGRQPVFLVGGPEMLAREIVSHYAPTTAAESVLEGLDRDDALLVETPTASDDVGEEAIESSPIIRLTNALLAEAIDTGASDIHIEATHSGGIVRYRIDGVLVTHLKLPLPVVSRVIARIKVIGGLDISDRRRPQDGRAHVSVENKPYDLRISTVPTRGTEKAVIRILDPSRVPDLASLGLTEQERASFDRLIQVRDGIILVTGPTGSGKTTTLYALLRQLATDEVNVMTVEDPVEYELPGVTQIQVAPAQGVTFASALRAILRQDPDVVLVGEIRDAETAEIAAQASMTGHLVLATLHTNDAVGVVRRLHDLGLDWPAIAETLRGAIAQRLLRRVCSSCGIRLEGALQPEQAQLAQRYGVVPVLQAAGCDQCHDKGYRGRLAVMEFFLVDSQIQEAIAQGPTHTALYRAARDNGMATLLDSGLQRVRAGDTTLDEVDRVLGAEMEGSDQVASSRSQPQPGGPAGGRPTDPAAVPDRATAISGGSVPLRLHVAEPGSDPAPARQPAVPAQPSPAGTAMPVRVLIADDQPVDRKLAKIMLERAGFQVVEAANGLDALRMLHNDPGIALVVSDLEMPQLDGRGLLEQIRATPGLQQLPVLIQTGTADPTGEAQLIDAGADDYVRKPLQPTRFIARVRATLRRSGIPGAQAPPLRVAI